MSFSEEVILGRDDFSSRVESSDMVESTFTNVRVLIYNGDGVCDGVVAHVGTSEVSRLGHCHLCRLLQRGVKGCFIEVHCRLE